MELFPLFGFIELKTALIVAHLFGVALGAGVAGFSAVMFMKVMYDGQVTKHEYEFIQLASHIVTVGLVILILSGLSLFSLNPEQYLASSKFMAKVTIIAILIVNGFLIHTFHVPALKKHLGESLPTLKAFRGRATLMYAGGAISMVSWSSALILGVFRGVPYSYTTIMSVYLAVLALGIITAVAMRFVTFGRVAPRL